MRSLFLFQPVVIFFLALASGSAFAQVPPGSTPNPPWKETENNGTIRLEIRDVPGLPYKEIRGTTTLNVPIATVASLLDDDAKIKSLLPYAIEASLVSRSLDRSLMYAWFKGKWVFQKREVYLWLTPRCLSQSIVIDFSTDSLPNDLPVAKASTVRMPIFKGFWELRPGTSPSTTEVVYQAYADIGTHSWIGWINRYATPRLVKQVLFLLRKHATGYASDIDRLQKHAPQLFQGCLSTTPS